jgi:hypothetical protein
MSPGYATLHAAVQKGKQKQNGLLPDIHLVIKVRENGWHE